MEKQRLSVCELNCNIIFHPYILRFLFLFAFILGVRQIKELLIKFVQDLWSEDLKILLISKMLNFEVGELESGNLCINKDFTFVLKLSHSLWF